MFDGRDITRAPPYERARAGLSLKFQITAVLTELSVYDNVLLALQSRREADAALLSLVPRRGFDGEVMQPLERFRLVDRADDLAGELSHGEQQWLEIAMALAPKPQAAAAGRADRRDEPGGAAGHRRAARADQGALRADHRRARPRLHPRTSATG